MLKQVPNTNVFIKSDKVLAFFVDKPHDYQVRLVCLFKDRHREVVINDVIVKDDLSGYLQEVAKEFDLDYFFDGLVGKKNLIEMVKYDRLEEKLLVKFKSFVVSIKLFVDSEIVKKMFS